MTLIATLSGIAFLGLIVAAVIVLAALSLAEYEPLYRVHWRLHTGATGNGEPIPLSLAIAWRDDMLDDPLLAGDEYWIEEVTE